MMFFKVLFVVAILPVSKASLQGKPFDTVKRQAGQDTVPLQVDLGYQIYEGVANASTGLNTFKGIRYAASPTGSLRWQRPQPPIINRSSVISAAEFGPTCPQAYEANNPLPAFAFALADEDCLFLSVYSPANASNLPVLVWIHGGGYGAGNGKQDLSSIINGNNNSFVGVAIQYRLGAFGFMSSDELYRNGVVNAGILDQTFALQWVQEYISQFGGNASQVTISGESAGGGSVMLQNIAYGGTLGTSLFVNTISASPYLPMQYGYKDWVPSQSYYAFASAVGCAPNWAYGNSSQTIFACINSKNTETLQRASWEVSASGTYGTWGFLPVTDGTFIQELPSQAILKRKLNGANQLSGNNAEEGPAFTRQNITTETDLIAWVTLVFPLFKPDDIAKILYYYPSSSSSEGNSVPEFATAGDMGATAVNVSQVASGQQQRADNIYAETTFVCPSYWLAEAYNRPGVGAGYKYQYSVPNAYHGSDVAGYFGPPTPNQGADLVHAFQTIWGNFIRTGNPSISSAIASGTSAGSTSTAQSGLEDWPPFTLYNPAMANLNQTGGVPYLATATNNQNVTEYKQPGLQNDLRLVNGYTWEGGRGVRCDFWKSLGPIVPE